MRCSGLGWHYSHLARFLFFTSCSRSSPIQPLITPNPGLVLRRLAGPGKQAGRGQPQVVVFVVVRSSWSGTFIFPFLSEFSLFFAHFCPLVSCLPVALPVPHPTEPPALKRWSLLGDGDQENLPFQGTSGDGVWGGGLGLGWGELKEDLGKSSQGRDSVSCVFLLHP